MPAPSESVGEMHSDLTQGERDEIMFQYKSRKIDMIVATDILARGIDIDDIRIVINYDVPRDCDDYIHRIGRTARAGSKGRAITFVSEEDQEFFGRIESFIEQDVPKLEVPAELGEAPAYEPKKKKKGDKGSPRNKRGRGGKKPATGKNGAKEEGKKEPRGRNRRKGEKKSSSSPDASKAPVAAESQPTTTPAHESQAAKENGGEKKKRNNRRYRRPRKKEDGGGQPKEQ